MAKLTVWLREFGSLGPKSLSQRIALYPQEDPTEKISKESASSVLIEIIALDVVVYFNGHVI